MAVGVVDQLQVIQIDKDHAVGLALAELMQKIVVAAAVVDPGEGIKIGLLLHEDISVEDACGDDGAMQDDHRLQEKVQNQKPPEGGGAANQAFRVLFCQGDRLVAEVVVGLALGEESGLCGVAFSRPDCCDLLLEGAPLRLLPGEPFLVCGIRKGCQLIGVPALPELFQDGIEIGNEVIRGLPAELPLDYPLAAAPHDSGVVDDPGSALDLPGEACGADHEKEQDQHQDNLHDLLPERMFSHLHFLSFADLSHRSDGLWVRKAGKPV